MLLKFNIQRHDVVHPLRKKGTNLRKMGHLTSWNPYLSVELQVESLVTLKPLSLLLFGRRIGFASYHCWQYGANSNAGAAGTAHVVIIFIFGIYRTRTTPIIAIVLSGGDSDK